MSEDRRAKRDAQEEAKRQAIQDKVDGTPGTARGRFREEAVSRRKQKKEDLAISEGAAYIIDSHGRKRLAPEASQTKPRFKELARQVYEDE